MIGDSMIPVSLYGVDEIELERFYAELPGLVADAYDDLRYEKALFSVKGNDTLEHISIADRWAEEQVNSWPEEIQMEVVMAIATIKYPTVGLLEHLLSLEDVDMVRISKWMHFETYIYPIYSEDACATLGRLGISTPFDPNDTASYGLYVSRLEGLKLHAPAEGMPELGLPRARMLQLGLERFR